MVNEIFRSQYTAAQIDASLGKTPIVNYTTRTWMLWDIETSQYVDSGVLVDSSILIDSTLSISGAAADAAKTGEYIAQARHSGEVLFEHGGYAVVSGAIVYNTLTTRVRVRPVHFANKILRLSVKTGYRLFVTRVEGGTAYEETALTVTGSVPLKWLVAKSNAEFAFLIRREDNANITLDEAYQNVSIAEYAHPILPVAHGLMRETVELAHNYYIPAITNPGEPPVAVNYAAYTGRASSAPIPIPKTGLKLSVNPARWQAGTSVPFRVVCVTYGDSGLILNETNADLRTEATTGVSTPESVFIPYIENAYVIIVSGDYGSDPARLVDAIYAYSGEIESYSANGKLLGLHPVRVFRDSNGVPQILFGSKNSVVNTSRYYGGALWLRYTKSITVAPPYDIVANIYRLEEDGTRTLVDFYYTMEGGTDAGRVAGVQHIDLSGYEFDGFVLYAVHNRVQYDATADSAVSYKKARGMGVMGQYLDVYNSVFVEYRNAYQYTVETGLQPTVFDNVNAFMQYKFPERLASYYVHEWESVANRHYFDATYDATPAFYAGSYDANEVFLNVVGKSYWTGMYNINSRCYQFVRDSEHAGTTDKGRIGYGLTCTDFVSVLLGLKENYPPSAMAFATPYKFDVVEDDWDYQTQMDLLRPGDILTEYVYGSTEGDDAATEHCMVCYEKKYVNGQLECVLVVEAGYPYTRFTALYNDKYVGLVGNFQSIRRLADYHYIRRIKPEYLTNIRETFDLSRSYTPGTIMCDRGTDSVYCVNPHPTDGWALEQPELLLTITDDTASSVIIYKNGTVVTSVSIGTQTRNGYRVLDIRDYILPYSDDTPEGLYELRTDTSADVQERFWVQAPRDFYVDGSTDRVVHVPDLAHLRYMAVVYRKTVIDQGQTKTANQYLIVTPEEFQAAEPEAGHPWDATWGEYTIPPTALDGATYALTKLIYGAEDDGTDFGTYQLQYLNPYGAGVAVYASSEYQFGA